MNIKEIKLTKADNDFIAYCYDKTGKQVYTISDKSIKEPSNFAYFVIDHLYIQEEINKKKIKLYWESKK